MKMGSIQRELKGYGFIPKKGWGQHFLTDRNIINRIIQTALVESQDVVLEVGPGSGEMTLALARIAKKVIAIEIDPKLVGILKKKTEEHLNVEVIEGDILKVDFHRFLDQDGQPLKVVANLPYQISTPLVFRLIEARRVFSSLTLMLQREVAERMVAPPGGKNYGPLSIFVQQISNPSLHFLIKPNAFYPPPKVESAVVYMDWKERSLVSSKDEEWFKRVVKGCFSYRRKTLINALKYSGLVLREGIETRVEQIGIDPKRRPETLTILEFKHLAEVLKS